MDADALVERRTSRPLVVVGGPPGGTRRHLARKLADTLSAKLVRTEGHHGCHAGRYWAGRLGAAVLGTEALVLEGAWFDDPEVDAIDRRMLDRIALRCTTGAVRPGSGLGKIGLGSSSPTAVPTGLHTPSTAHPLVLRTAGNLKAPVVLVGEKVNGTGVFGLPFVSFAETGCSRWFTQQLDDAEIGEDRLLWVNADQDLDRLKDLVRPSAAWVALGQEARRRCLRLDVAELYTVDHPSYRKRFRYRETWDAIDLIGRLAEEGSRTAG